MKSSFLLPRILYFILWGIFLSLSLTTGINAQDLPERPNPPRLVNDYAEMLSPEEEEALEQKLIGYEDTTSTQIAIVTRRNLGEYEAGDYAFRLAEKWGIGQKGKSNGVIILVSLEDRHTFIAVGYGLEGVMPDAYVARIRDESLRPNLKAGRYFQAFDQATSSLMALAAGEFKADPKNSNKGSGGGFLIILIILFFVFILPMFLKARRIQRSHFGSGGMDLLSTILMMSSLNKGNRGGSSWGDFKGGRGDFGGGGGFGGFGGGSFGGGGAGGDW